MKANPLLGPDGKPISESSGANSGGDLHIEIQALVEARVNTALDAARENLRHEIANAKQELKDDIAHGKRTSVARFILFAVANAILAFILYLYGPSEVRKWTQTFVADNMNKPTLEAAAKDVVTNRMDSFVSQRLLPVSTAMTSHQAMVSEVGQNLKQLREEQRLISLMSRGEIFDREAMHELEALARGTNETAELAKAMVSKVQRTLLLDRNSLSYLILREKTGEEEYQGPFTSDEISERLWLSPNPHMEAIVNTIGNEKRSLFVPKLVDLAHSSKDLWVVNRIGNALKSIAGVSFYAWDLQPLDDWWAQRRMEFTNWPFVEFEKARVAFCACKYGEALTNYESVLAVDPAADKSRALAVACATEIGNLPKAQQLNRDYALKDGRWNQWANAKLMLATNATEQGTREFVSLVKKYPTFVQAGLIQEGNNVLKQVNWRLFSELMKPASNTVSSKTNMVK